MDLQIDTIEILLVLLSSIAFFLTAILRAVQKLIQNSIDNKIKMSQAQIDKLRIELANRAKDGEQDLLLRQRNIERVDRLESQIAAYQKQIEQLSNIAAVIERVVQERIEVERANLQLETDTRQLSAQLDAMRSDVQTLKQTIALNQTKHEEQIQQMQKQVQDYQDEISRLHELLRKRDYEILNMHTYVAGIRDALSIVQLSIVDLDNLEEKAKQANERITNL